MKEYIGKRLLVTVGDNDAPQLTSLLGISPNGLYGCFDDPCVACTLTGWLPLASVKVLDVVGVIGEPLSKLHQRLAAYQ